MKYEFTIPGPPVGKQRARVFTPPGGKYPIATTPPKTRNYEALIKMCATEAQIPMMDYFKMSIEIFLPMRLKKYKTKPDVWLEPRQRPDRTNIEKSVEDALQGIAIKNDKDILSSESCYRFTKQSQPFVRVQITEVDWQDYIEVNIDKCEKIT